MMASTAVVKEATQVWKLLNGIVCLYKPLGMPTKTMNIKLLMNVCADLNSMKCREPETFVKIERIEKGKEPRPQIQAPVSSTNYPDNHLNVAFTPKVLHTIPDTPNSQVQVIKTINYADHPLVVGPRYQITDFKLKNVNSLGRDTSGVALIGLNDGAKWAHSIQSKRWLRAYVLSAELGKATEDGFYTSKVIEKTKYHKITAHMLEKALMSQQAAHQRTMYQAIKVPLTSQVAYDLASQGLVRPDDTTDPIVYGFKLIKFEPPYFEIEVNIINETQVYLKTIPHMLALKLHSSAMCTKIRCIKYGPFNVDDTLLFKHWSAEDLLNNMDVSRQLIDGHDLRLRARQPLIGVGGAEVQDDNSSNDSVEESSSERRSH